MKSFHRIWQKGLNGHIEIVNRLLVDNGLLNKVNEIACVILAAYRSGGKLLICGNGGSAADSQHIAAELTGRFYLERAALDSEALTTNTSCITAIGNDYAYDQIFARQVEAKGRLGDVLLGISTSGNSENIINAMIVARKKGIVTVGLIGGDASSRMVEVSDFCINVPSTETPRTQEMHILIGHLLCEFIENELFGAASETKGNRLGNGVVTKVIAA